MQLMEAVRCGWKLEKSEPPSISTVKRRDKRDMKSQSILFELTQASVSFV